MGRIINKEEGSTKGYKKGKDPAVRDSRKLAQKYDKDIVFCIFIEKNKETNEYDEGTRIGLASYGNNPGTTSLANYISNICMQVVRGEVHKIIKTLKKNKVEVVSEQEANNVIKLHDMSNQLKKG